MKKNSKKNVDDLPEEELEKINKEIEEELIRINEEGEQPEEEEDLTGQTKWINFLFYMTIIVIIVAILKYSSLILDVLDML